MEFKAWLRRVMPAVLYAAIAAALFALSLPGIAYASDPVAHFTLDLDVRQQYEQGATDAPVLFLSGDNSTAFKFIDDDGKSCSLCHGTPIQRSTAKIKKRIYTYRYEINIKMILKALREDNQSHCIDIGIQQYDLRWHDRHVFEPDTDNNAPFYSGRVDDGDYSIRLCQVQFRNATGTDAEFEPRLYSPLNASSRTMGSDGRMNVRYDKAVYQPFRHDGGNEYSLIHEGTDDNLVDPYLVPIPTLKQYAVPLHIHMYGNQNLLNYSGIELDAAQIDSATLTADNGVAAYATTSPFRGIARRSPQAG